MNDTAKYILKMIWLAFKLAVAIFAIFHGTNVNILYQGF